jgi:hypothetical protein
VKVTRTDEIHRGKPLWCTIRIRYYPFRRHIVAEFFHLLSALSPFPSHPYSFVSRLLF